MKKIILLALFTLTACAEPTAQSETKHSEMQKGGMECCKQMDCCKKMDGDMKECCCKKNGSGEEMCPMMKKGGASKHPSSSKPASPTSTEHSHH